MSTHISGLLAASRVVSLAPLPYDTPESPCSARLLASAYATACGRWLVQASWRSWFSALIRMGDASIVCCQKLATLPAARWPPAAPLSETENKQTRRPSGRGGAEADLGGAPRGG